MQGSANLNLMIKAARRAGKSLVKDFREVENLQVSTKGPGDFVSKADREAERLIKEDLMGARPTYGWLGEETGGEDGADPTRRWIVDPLDGTTNFIHGLPVFAVSIGLMEKDEVVLGVVYEVNRKECFYAYKGGGAFCNGVAIQVSKAPNLAASLIATGFPYYQFDLIDRYMAIMKSLMQKTHGLRRLGSAAVDLCYVAAGRSEGYFEYNLNSYDVAAGVLLVQEAGGQVTDFGGGRDFIFGRQVVATNRLIHQELMEVVGEHWDSSAQ